jgi:hypothetical protein
MGVLYRLEKDIKLFYALAGLLPVYDPTVSPDSGSALFLCLKGYPAMGHLFL